MLYRLGCVVVVTFTLAGGDVKANSSAPLVIEGVNPVAFTEPDYETPPQFITFDILPVELQSSDWHWVDYLVTNDGYNNHYVVHSDFGRTEVEGQLVLERRVQEIYAIAFLQELNRGEAAAQGAGNAAKGIILGPWKTAKRIVRNPLYAVTAVPTQIFSLIGIVTDTRLIFQEGVPEYLREQIGYNEAKKQLARGLDVDPNTQNELLQEELGRDAWGYTAGHFPGDIAGDYMMISVPMTVQVGAAGTGNLGGATKDVVDQFTASSERKQLKRLNFSKEEREAFKENAHYTRHTRRDMVDAVYALEDVPNRAAYLKCAMDTEAEAEAIGYSAMSRYMTWSHENETPFQRVFDAGGWPLFYTENEVLVAPIQADYLVWTKDFEDRLFEMETQVPPWTPIEGRELWVFGDISPRARTEMEERGYTVRVRSLTTIEGIYWGDKKPWWERLRDNDKKDATVSDEELQAEVEEPAGDPN